MSNNSQLEQPAGKQVKKQPAQQDSVNQDSPEPAITAAMDHLRQGDQSLSTQQVLQLQRTIGNRAVARVIHNMPSKATHLASAAATVQREVQIVKEETPEEEAFKKEHEAQPGLAEEDAGATAVSKMGAPGPICTAALQPNIWGYCIPESFTPTLTATLANKTWTASATDLTGTYSIATRLIGTVAEVTGPGGNTTKTNYAKQVADLRALSRNWGTWYMLKAIADHEAVHETRMAPALTATEAAINALFAALTVPESATVNSADTAVAAIKATPAYAAAVSSAFNLWNAKYFVLIGGDHNGTAGPTYDAERAVVNPMIAKINAHATAPAQNWGPAA